MDNTEHGFELAGLNQEIAPVVTAKVQKVPVIEIFGPTIQGEGNMIGVKTMFVRFGGCDYRCTKCDSLHAVMPKAIKKHAAMMTAEQIFEQLYLAKKNTGVEWVTLSGGNPCIWDLEHLIRLCREAGIRVAVETQGTQWRRWVPMVDQVTLSPKGPGMGEKFEEDKFRAFVMTTQDDLGFYGKISLKVVAFDQRDFEFIVHLDRVLDELSIDREQRFISLGNTLPPILDVTNELVSDVQNNNVVENCLRNYHSLLEDFYLDKRISHWRFLPQLHVLVYGNDKGK